MSAQANLAGLFYPSEEEMWSDLPWQPIPVHTVPKKLDKVRNFFLLTFEKNNVFKIFIVYYAALGSGIPVSEIKSGRQSIEKI